MKPTVPAKELTFAGLVGTMMATITQLPENFEAFGITGSEWSVILYGAAVFIALIGITVKYEPWVKI